MTANAMQIIDLSVDLIDVSAFNPRRYYDEEAEVGLKDSIDSRGQIYPVLVRPQGERYELFIGSRRLRVAQAREQNTVAAIVRHDLTDQDVLEFALTENLQRSDLTPYEEAWAILKLIEDFKLGIQAVAKRIGKHESFVRRRIKLLSMPDEVQTHMREGNLSVNHIDHLTSLKCAEDQIAFAQTVVDHKLSEGDLVTLIQEELESVQGRRRDSREEMSGVKVSLRIKGATSLINRLAPRVRSLQGDEQDEVIEALQVLQKTLDGLLSDFETKE